MTGWDWFVVTIALLTAGGLGYLVATSREEYVQVKGVGAVLRRKQGPMWQLDDEDCAATPARLRVPLYEVEVIPPVAEPLGPHIVVPFVPLVPAPGPQPDEVEHAPPEEVLAAAVPDSVPVPARSGKVKLPDRHPNRRRRKHGRR